MGMKYYYEHREEQLIKMRERYKNNKERYLTANKEYNAKPENQRRKHERNIIKRFGIDLKEYENLLEKQNFQCAICYTDTPGTKVGWWNIDHCHQTKKVRGLLCSNCNLALGHFKDDTIVLQNAINYLEAA